MADDKPPAQSSLYRETQRPDFLEGVRRDEKVRKQGPGIGYMVAGLIFGVIGVSRIITLIPDAWSIIAGDGTEAATLTDSRMQIAVGIISGLAGVICAEVGTRREGGWKLWLGMVGSVLGIFSVIVGAALAVLLFTEAS